MLWEKRERETISGAGVLDASTSSVEIPLHTPGHCRIGLQPALIVVIELQLDADRVHLAHAPILSLICRVPAWRRPFDATCEASFNSVSCSVCSALLSYAAILGLPPRPFFSDTRSLPRDTDALYMLAKVQYFRTPEKT